MQSSKYNRRNFLKGAGAVTAGGILLPNLWLPVRGQEASKKLQIGCIGVGGKGGSDMDGAADGNEIVAICDVDANNLKRAQEKYPNARAFSNYKIMIEEMAGKMDAVTVSTPDHAHFPAAMMAIAKGMHVCVQKPLVNTLWEVRELHLAAKKKGVITRMGNQGHTGEGIRKLKEWIQAGIIGKVKEVHVWTNRPIWRQGKDATYRPATAPEGLDWKSWLAGCPDAPYIESVGKDGKTKGIHPFEWRGHIEYGAGAMGDMGCHLMDGPVFALGLGVPTKIDAEGEETTDTAWPKASTIKCFFPATKDHGDINFTWYDGGRKPERPAGLEDGRQLGGGGFVIVGEGGSIYNEGDYCDRPTLLPYTKHQEWLSKNDIAKTIERSHAAGNPQKEWTMDIKRGKSLESASHFDYAVPLTELCLLGNLALRAGKPIEWDSEKLEVKGMPEMAKYTKRAAYREGYEITAASIT